MLDAGIKCPQTSVRGRRNYINATAQKCGEGLGLKKSHPGAGDSLHLKKKSIEKVKSKQCFLKFKMELPNLKWGCSSRLSNCHKLAFYVLYF